MTVSIYLLLDWNTFSQYPRWTIAFASSQSKRASDNTWTNQNSCYKSENQVEVASACERCVDESDFSFESSLNLHKNTERSAQNRKTVKIRFFKGNTSKWGVKLSWKSVLLWLIALESDVHLADLAAREHGWEVESFVVPCEVLLARNHSTSSGSKMLTLLLVTLEDLHLLIGLWV